MPIYTSDQNVRSGVPLGGIGAGKLEIMPSGLLDHFTFLNGTHRPMSSNETQVPRGMLGFHFGIFVQDKGKRVSRMLQAMPVGDIAGVASVKYDGAFPMARLEYQDEALPVAVTLEALSSFIPRNEKDSALPAAIFRFKISNPWARPITVSLLATSRNIVGAWGVGRFNQVSDDPRAVHLLSFNKKTQPHDLTGGEMCLSVVKDRKSDYFYCGEWNMQAKHFVFEKDGLTLGEAGLAFAADGTLPNTSHERVVPSESYQLGGALAAKTVLKPKTSTTVTFILSWHFPHPAEGHMYENWFRSAQDVAKYVVEKEDGLIKATREWVKSVQSLNTEPWLKDALLNNLYTLVSGSFWSKKNRFGLFEAPEVCPLLGTLDVRFYGSLPLAMLFPSLELKEMFQFAEAQKPQGYIPHDLGRERSDLPSLSTNGLCWKDLNAKFILLCYRDYLWTKDESFLKKTYPFIKKAFYWLTAADKNKDFLPDEEGADQTFDLWPFYGAGSYTGSIFLAALLALEKMAQHLQDSDMTKEAQTWFKKGSASFEKKLWNRTYFMAYNNVKEGLSEKQLVHHAKTGKVNLSCTVGQLAGQWYAHLLGLGYIVAPDKVKKAVATMLERNASLSPFGAVNAVTVSGERDKSNWQSGNCWFGLTYALAGLAMHEGFIKEGLALAKKAWDNASVNTANPWNQPDMFDAADGSFLFGDHYMRNAVIWSLACTLAKNDKSVATFLGKYRS